MTSDTGKLTRESLMSLEQYAGSRKAFREKVMQHKKPRQVHLGPNATLYFEDRLTMQYQVQEMLRIERIFEPEGIQEELEAYNPLIPDGSNWKATFMIEFPEEEQRRTELARLIGIENRVWVQTGDARSWAIADEDLERENENKTSAVHFLRFELTRQMIEAIRAGAPLSIGVAHENYGHEASPVAEETRESLLADLA